MKILKTIIIALLLLSINNHHVLAQAKGVKTIVDPKNPKGMVALTNSDFEQSVMVVTDFSKFSAKDIGKPLFVTVELVNFHPTKKLLPAYTIKGIAFNDDGKHNDQVAGDGIFTSVSAVKINNKSIDFKKYYSKASGFKYETQFDQYARSQMGVNQRLGISITCKTRIITCPEEHWYDSCWPLSSPCTCVDFYDCEVEFDLTIF